MLHPSVKLDPDNAVYHNMLGVTLSFMKRYDEALAELQKAVELGPDNASFHYILGATLAFMKRYEETWTE